METRWIVLLLISFLSLSNGFTDNSQRRFKPDFMFGVATSAYQVEGAWNADGKGENIWDRYLHSHPELIVDGVNGDEACDSYHQYRRDVEMLSELGVDFYRFSISWSRVLPTGFPNKINKLGLIYYDNLIEELLRYNIIPMVTLYHFDLPQRLQDLGGWANPLSVQWFKDYAEIIFNRYANKVKYWITINQPSVCLEPETAPGLDGGPGGEGTVGGYLCLKHMMLAHAEAYRLYEKDFKQKYKDRTVYATNEGDWPAVVKEIVAKKSKEEGYPSSRLPSLLKEEIKLLKGSADFLGMNHYTTFLVEPGKGKDVTYFGDLPVTVTRGEQWDQGKSPWLKAAPFGLYKALLYINKEYDYPKIIITEHGWSTDTGIDDTQRVNTVREYLKALLLGIEDGSEVLGYTYWSLMDNVEWLAGTSERFGLYEVDFTSPNKTRTARRSALFYKFVIERRFLKENWRPDNKQLRIGISNRRFEITRDEL